MLRAGAARSWGTSSRFAGQPGSGKAKGEKSEARPCPGGTDGRRTKPSILIGSAEAGRGLEPGEWGAQGACLIFPDREEAVPAALVSHKMSRIRFDQTESDFIFIFDLIADYMSRKATQNMLACSLLLYCMTNRVR